MSKVLQLSLQENLKKHFLLECAFDIFFKDQLLAQLFLPLCKIEDLSKFLKEIISKIPLNKETLDIRWSICSTFLSLNEQIENDMSNEIALNDLLSLNDQAINIIKKYIDFKGEIKKGVAHDLSFCIQLLRDDYPGIFYSILPNLQGIISIIRSDRIYKAIGPNFITFFMNPPCDFYNQINEFDEQELPSFFQFHTNFTHPELSISLETKISNIFFYPSSIKGIENSVNFTLTNSSLCRNKPFIDTIYDIVNKAIESQSNPRKIQNLIEPVISFFPYFIVANQTILLREKKQYLQNLLEILDTNSHPSQIIERFRADFKFLNFISNQVGKKYGYGDLFIDSFPFLLRNAIHNIDEILTFSKFNYFSINDNHRDNDFDFIRSYGIFHLILSIIKNNSQCPNQTQLSNTLNKISLLLNDISNEKTKSKVIIDLFSCVFIEDKSHQFICHPLIAQQIISILISYQVPIQIYRANALFENNQATKSDTSIAPWLNNDTFYIYSAIENKDWDLAKNLTAYLPYYIKLYSEAMQADKFINDNDYTVENNVKINALLSIKTEKDKLKESQKKRKSIDLVDTIIDNRLQKVSDPEILCCSDEHKNTFQSVSIFSVEFDENLEKSLKKIKNFQQDHFITRVSESLDGFLNYLYKYYRCAILIDSTTFDSIEDLFKFNFQRAIEGSLLHDQMESAEELTKCINIDLFKFVFENLHSFEINSNLIKNLAVKFPLEATALSVSNHVETELPSKMKSISDYFIFLEKLKSQENSLNEINNINGTEKNSLIDTILKPNLDDIDDLIFLVDHDELYNQMMMKFDNKTIATHFYKVFSFVSYVAPESDSYRLKSIETYHQVFSISDKMDLSEIINNLYQKEENYFYLIMDFIQYWVSPSDQTSLISKLLNLTFRNNDEQKIDLILKSFPDHFDVIMTRFYYYEGFLPHLIKFSPNYEVQFLKTISLLPSQIFNDCNIFDIDSIARAYIRYPIQILGMPKLIADYFSDQHLFTILKGIKNSQYANQIFLHLYQFFRDKSLIIDFWSDIIDSELKKMTVDSGIKEIEISNIFNQLRKPISIINDSKFKQYGSLSRFVDLNPFIRYHFTYSFTKLRQPGFINEILSVCSKMDNENIIFDISDSFGAQLDDIFFSRAYLQLILGDIEGSINMIQERNLKIDNYSHPPFYDSTYNFLYPLSKIPIFHYNDTNKNNNDNIEEKDKIETDHSLYNNLFECQKIPEDVFLSSTNFLKSIPKGIKKKTFSSKEAKESINLLISKHCSPGPALSLFISFQQFDFAYEFLDGIESREEKIDLFINNICLPVFFNNLDSKFMDFVMKSDKNLEKTKFLWDAIIDFFRKNDMKQGLIFALQIENKLEDAAIVGFESLKSCTSFIMEVTILGNIIINLKSAMNYRKREYDIDESDESSQTEETSNSPLVVINENKSFDEINEYLNIAELQLSVSKFCIEKSFPFSHDYDLIQSKKGAAESVAALLFIKKQYELMMGIKNTLKLSKTEILCKASDLICKESPEKIKKFVQGLSKVDKLDLLKALAMTNNRQVFFSVMYDCFDKQEQLLLFLDYNFIVDSFALAYASKNLDLIPLIAHKAAMLGDTRTVHECEKILSQT